MDAEFLRTTAAGKNLVGVGLESDLELCASLDRHSLVPEMRDRRITVPLCRQRSRTELVGLFDVRGLDTP